MELNRLQSSYLKKLNIETLYKKRKFYERMTIVQPLDFTKNEFENLEKIYSYSVAFYNYYMIVNELVENRQISLEKALQ